MKNLNSIQQKMLKVLSKGPRAFKQLNFNGHSFTNSYHLKQLISKNLIHTKSGIYSLIKHELNEKTIKEAKKIRKELNIEEKKANEKFINKYKKEQFNKLSEIEKVFYFKISKIEDYKEAKTMAIEFAERNNLNCTFIYDKETAKNFLHLVGEKEFTKNANPFGGTDWFNFWIRAKEHKKYFKNEKLK